MWTSSRFVIIILTQSIDQNKRQQKKVNVEDFCSTWYCNDLCAKNQRTRMNGNVELKYWKSLIIALIVPIRTNQWCSTMFDYQLVWFFDVVITFSQALAESFII